ncbi:hypothetical protein A5742_05885 [Mycolicibacterium fortuitum]|uniref:Uncharacterized protein n=1 Tax=Mycolicibacterium fortuitum TaxID=1766 RepID=A0ABD6QH23_MYCFO|nr:hypothetical protein A5742_05885 [Mycolicibacterium fortuitum]
MGGARGDHALDQNFNGLFWAGLHCFEHVFTMLVCNLFGNRSRVAIHVVEFERLRRDHRAQRVPLTPRGIYSDAHIHLPHRLLSNDIPCGSGSGLIT